MTHIKLAFALALTGAACTPLSLYYKEGASVQSVQDAQTRCEVAASKDVPVRQVTRVIPARRLPPVEVCPRKGQCHIKPGRFVPPEYVTHDANESLRREAAALCMREKGYRFLKLPACDQAVANAVSEGQTRRLPRLSKNACVVRGKQGRWQIVNPVRP